MGATDWVAMIGGILTILVILVAGLGWYVKTVVRQEIQTWTKTIQPGYRNGGSSLADISAKIDFLMEKVQ